MKYKLLNLKFFFFIIIAAYGGLPSQVQGATYIVSLSGNDTNDGLSESTAFRTINKGVQAVKAGDTVIVKPGEYGKEEVTLTASGTSDSNRIVIMAETPGTVTLGDEVSCLSDGCRTGIGFFLKASNFITIDGFHIRNYNTGIRVQPGHSNIYQNNILRSSSGQGIWLRGDNDNTVVEKNTFIDIRDIAYSKYYGTQDYGVAIYGSRNVKILNNYFYGPHSQVISFKRETSNCLVSGNTFEGVVAGVYLGQNDATTSGDSYCGEVSDCRSFDITVENNVFRPTEDFVLRYAVVVRNIRRAVVRNNFVEGLDGSSFGILVNAIAEDVVIYNNIIWNGDTYGIGIDAPVSLYNNVIVNTKGIYLRTTGDWFGIPYNGKILNNLNNYENNSYSYSSNPEHFEGPFTNLTKPSAPIPQFTPDFSRAFAFRPKSTSPLVDAGTTVPEVTTDIMGLSRPRGSGFDIGAFEFSNGVTNTIINSNVNVSRETMLNLTWAGPESCYTLSGKQCGKKLMMTADGYNKYRPNWFFLPQHVNRDK